MTQILQIFMGILFSVIPVAIVIGPAIIDIIMSLIAILFIILSIYNKDYTEKTIYIQKEILYLKPQINEPLD